MIFPSSVPKGRCDRRYIGHSLYNSQRKGANELHALGRHLVLELNGCNPKLLNDVKRVEEIMVADRKSTRLNSSHLVISYAVFCLKKKNRSKKNTKINYISER